MERGMALALIVTSLFFWGQVEALPQTGAFPTHIEGPDVLTLQKAKVGLVSAGATKKGLVVVFLSAVCPCSNSHMKELASLSKDYPGFAFVGVHSNREEGQQMTLDYFQKAALPFPVLQDDGTKWADVFRALKTPHVFVVNKAGNLAYQGGVSSSQHFEFADRKFLREALEDLDKERPVRTPRGRALGCAISREEDLKAL